MILHYLDIFTIDSKVVEKCILSLNKELGSNFVYLIGNNMSYLEKILEYESSDIDE